MTATGCTCETDAREHYQRHVTPDEVAWWCGMFGCRECVAGRHVCGEGETGRHHRNGHILELDGCMWRCIHCDHKFDAASDADLFWCGDDCAGKHPGNNEGPEST